VHNRYWPFNNHHTSQIYISDTQHAHEINVYTTNHFKRHVRFGVTEQTRMEDSRKDNLGMEKMMNGDRIQSMKENEVKKVEIQQMLGSAKSNQGFPFVNLTMQVGVMIFGVGNIEQVVVWDQKTAQAVTFVLKSTLDRNAQPWLPQGRGQECKEDEVVEEEDKNTEQHYGSDFKSSSDIEVEVAAKAVKQDTKVKTMSVEQMVKILAEKQYFTEAKEGVKQSEIGEQKVCYICCSAESLHKIKKVLAVSTMDMQKR